MGWITSYSKEPLHLRDSRPQSTIKAKATCREPGRRPAASAEPSPWVTSIGPAGGRMPAPRYTSQSGREHVAGNPVGCQSLLSKQELGLRVINHGPSDSNPGPYLYPKKCRWSPVPSSIKETDSSNKEAPYQISAREPEAARGRCGKGFYKAGTRDAAGGSGGFTRRAGLGAGPSAAVQGPQCKWSQTKPAPGPWPPPRHRDWRHTEQGRVQSGEMGSSSMVGM